MSIYIYILDSCLLFSFHKEKNLKNPKFQMEIIYMS